MYHLPYCCEPCGLLESNIIYNACENISPIEKLTIINQPSTVSNQGARPIFATKISGAGYVIATTSAIDRDDNIIVAGVYYGDCPTKILSGTLINFYNCNNTIGHTLNSTSNYNVFISKYNPSGFVLWVTKICGISHETNINITVDMNNNIIIVGQYENKIDILNSNGDIIASLPEAVGISSFIIKFDQCGNPLWATTIISTSIVIATAVTSDITNNIYLTGYYSGSSIENCEAVRFYNTDDTVGATLPTATGRDAFIAKYNSSGHAIWTTKIGSTSTTTSTVNISCDIAITLDKCIIVSGLYQTTPLIFYNTPNGNCLSGISLEHSSIVHLECGYPSKQCDSESKKCDCNTNCTHNNISKKNIMDAFVSKYNEHGVAIWATRIVGQLNDLNISIAVDNSNDIIVTSRYSSKEIIIYSTLNCNFPAMQLMNSGGNDSFIIKYDACGILLWATRIAGVSRVCPEPRHGALALEILPIKNSIHRQISPNRSSTSRGFANHNITTDSNSNIIITGNFGFNRVIFYNANGLFGSNLAGTTSDNSFVAKYNRCGVVIWAAKQIATNTCIGLTVSTDFCNNIIITGAYQAKLLSICGSNGNVLSKLRNTGLVDTFIIKYSDFCQVLVLQPSLNPYTTKTLILKGYNGTNTLITAAHNLLVDQKNCASSGIVLTNHDAAISLVWTNNRWNIVSIRHVIIMYD